MSTPNGGYSSYQDLLNAISSHVGGDPSQLFGDGGNGSFSFQSPNGTPITSTYQPNYGPTTGDDTGPITGYSLANIVAGGKNDAKNYYLGQGSDGGITQNMPFSPDNQGIVGGLLTNPGFLLAAAPLAAGALAGGFSGVGAAGGAGAAEVGAGASGAGAAGTGAAGAGTFGGQSAASLFNGALANSAVDSAALGTGLNAAGSELISGLGTGLGGASGGAAALGSEAAAGAYGAASSGLAGEAASGIPSMEIVGHLGQAAPGGLSQLLQAMAPAALSSIPGLTAHDLPMPDMPSPDTIDQIKPDVGNQSLLDKLKGILPSGASDAYQFLKDNKDLIRLGIGGAGFLGGLLKTPGTSSGGPKGSTYGPHLTLQDQLAQLHGNQFGTGVNNQMQQQNFSNYFGNPSDRVVNPLPPGHAAVDPRTPGAGEHQWFNYPGQTPAQPGAQPFGQSAITQPITLKDGGDVSAASDQEAMTRNQMSPLMQATMKPGMVIGAGDGQSDSIPAQLANGEYVMDADTVSALGNGSTDAGSKMLDQFRENLRSHKRSAGSGSIPPPTKAIHEYFKKG